MPSINSQRRCPQVRGAAASLLLVCGLVPAGGCATRGSFLIPPCPAPSMVAVDQLVLLASRDNDRYDELVNWVSEIDRYCSAIDAAR